MTEFSSEDDFRTTPISLDYGHEVLCRAISMAIGRNKGNPDETEVSQLEKVFGELFTRYDSIKRDSEMFAQAYPERDEPQITIGALTSDLHSEVNAIYTRHQTETGVSRVNPFMINNERLDALNSASYLVYIAFTGTDELLQDQGDSDYHE